MKKTVIFIAVFLFALFLIADRLLSEEKTNENISYSKNESAVSDDIDLIPESRYRPLNFTRQKAMWFTYMDYAEILASKTEDEFKSALTERFEKAAMLGINTVYVQVRAFCDAYYKSELFPAGKYYTDTSFDPLAVMISAAHSYGLSFHAWINPLRCVNADEIGTFGSPYRFEEMYSENMLHEVNDRLWLDPSYEDTRKYVTDGISEIIRNYNVDGIHIDDYFYPSPDASFDKAEFERSGASDLAEWRCENINKLVSEIYKTIKRENSMTLFGISPQGNMQQNLSSQYADTAKWISEDGFCDYIVPQIYYGYENEGCPFSETVDLWINAVTGNTKLIIGLCTYKNGIEDKWAGKGINEWINNSDISSRQVRECMNNERLSGVAIYSYSSTFEDDVSSEIMLDGEIQEIRECLKDN